MVRVGQLSHRLLDQMHEVAEEVGTRRVHRDVGLAGGLPRIFAPRLGDGVLENGGLGFLLLGRAAAHQDADGLLEVEQPAGQVQGVDVDDLRQIAESGGILVVGIEQHDMGVGMGREHGAEDDRHGTGLARARGAEDGKIPAEQVIGLEIGGPCRVLAEAADPHMNAVRLAIDEVRDRAIGEGEGRTQGGVGGHPPAEALALGPGTDLAQEVDDLTLPAVAVARFQGTHQANDHGAVGRRRHELADLQPAPAARGPVEGDRGRDAHVRDRDDLSDFFRHCAVSPAGLSVVHHHALLPICRQAGLGRQECPGTGRAASQLRKTTRVRP